MPQPPKIGEPFLPPEPTSVPAQSVSIPVNEVLINIIQLTDDLPEPLRSEIKAVATTALNQSLHRTFNR